MTLIRKLIIISILFFLGCKIYAQNEKNLQPLKNILFSLEKKHNIYFNYLDSDIEKISILSPPKNLNLNKKIAYLEKKTDLFFEKISTNIFAIHSSKKKFKICGYVFSNTENSPVYNAVILLENGEKTNSNSYGYYEIMNNEPINYTIIAPEFNSLNVSADDEISGKISHFFLEEKVKLINEILIKKYISTGIEKDQDGSYIISPKKGGIIPGLVEPDVLQTMLYLPGIYSIDESLSNINVRSGTHDQNLILWNNIKLYQTGHFFGLISTINPYLSNEIKIYKNASPAFYGEGISSVVDISTDSNFSDKNKYSIGINMLNTDIYTKTNISKKSFIEIAARKSYTEFLQSPTYKEYFQKAFQNSSIINFSNQNNIDYSTTDKNFNFYDISTKIVHQISDKNLLILDFITISDQLNVTQENNKTSTVSPIKSSIYQRNFGASLSWKTSWNAKNTSVINFSNSQYELDSHTTNLADLYGNMNKENFVFDSSLKINNSYKINSKYNVNIGYQLNLLHIQNIMEDKNSSFFEKSNENIEEHALYAEAKIKDSISKINISGGLRANYISQFKKTMLEPRFQFSYSYNKNLCLNILGEMKSQTASQQIDHQNDFFGIEKRWWVLANNTTIPVQRSRQISFGLDFNRNNWLMTIETYYKKVLGINSTSQGFQNQYQYIKTIGNYQVKGVEFFLQKRIHYFLTWANYNFGRSTYNFPELTPKIFQNNFQINHFFSLGCNFEKNRYKVAIGSKWHSGKPETEIANNAINYSIPENPVIDYNTPNSNNQENFFQIDTSASYIFKTKKKVQLDFNFSILNLLNTKNEINEYYKMDTANNLIEKIKSFSLSRTFNAGFRASF